MAWLAMGRFTEGREELDELAGSMDLKDVYDKFKDVFDTRPRIGSLKKKKGSVTVK